MSNKLYNAHEIQELLGFRPAYPLVDRIRYSSKDKRIEGLKNVSVNDPFFMGHFPENPVMPGIMQLETMFQLTVFWYRILRPGDRKFPILSQLDKVKFRRSIVPGDQLQITPQILSLKDNEICVNVSILVEDRKASEAQMVVKFPDNPEQLLSPKDFLSRQSNPGTDPSGLTFNEIQKIIPHRYPFTFIDRILEKKFDEDGSCTIIGLKNTTANETLSLSHFREFPFLSSFFHVEMIAQVGCVYMLGQNQNNNKYVYFMSIDNALFHRPAIPGDQLLIETISTSIKEKYGKGKGRILVNNECIAEAEIKFAVVDSGES